MIASYEDFGGFIRAFEGFCWLEEVFRPLEATNITYNAYPIESDDLISIIPD